jgi:hypothetical protein
MAERFAIIPAAALERLPALSGAATKVMVGLASYMGRDGCFPSVTTLGRITGITRRPTVFKALSELETAGLIVRNQHSGRVTTYTWTPEPVTKSVTGTSNEKRNGLAEPISESVTPPVTKSVTGPVTESVTHNIPVKQYQLTVPAAQPRRAEKQAEIVKAKATPAPVPDELFDLELFAGDSRLCRDWPRLLPGWRKAFPLIDIPAEMAKAHVWLIAKDVRRKNYGRFLSNWFGNARAEERHAVGDQNGHSPEAVARFEAMEEALARGEMPE